MKCWDHNKCIVVLALRLKQPGLPLVVGTNHQNEKCPVGFPGICNSWKNIYIDQRLAQPIVPNVIGYLANPILLGGQFKSPCMTNQTTSTDSLKGAPLVSSIS